jgi:hypothetical protein
VWLLTKGMRWLASHIFLKMFSEMTVTAAPVAKRQVTDTLLKFKFN